MKNIHISPTHNKSRLYYFNGKKSGFYLYPSNQMLISRNSNYSNKNIYITSSDEKIKKGDWVLFMFDEVTEIVKVTTIVNNAFDSKEGFGYGLEYCKKITLTTDQDLIKDGVQAIDDEFLEWFVKNPSCKFVEVISYSGFELANTYTKAEVDDLIQKKGVRWIEVMGAGTSITTLTGTDDYGNTLAYTPGTEQVFINGLLIARGIDYTATDGTSVVLNEALSPGDIVEISGTSTFSVANVYSKTEVDNKLEDFMMISLSDEISTVVTGTAKVTMRAPFAMTLTQIPRASLNTASSSGIPTIDIKKNGTTILGANKLTIDANEKTSVTAATATTLATTAIANDDEITFDVTVAGTGAKGLKVVLYYTRA